jgi:hypothetical protein
MKSKEKLAEEYRKTTPNQMYGDELGFLAGFNSAEKEIKKQLKDLKNKYSSWLTTEQGVKLGKTINQEEILKLRTKLELIKEIEKKLWHN